MMTGSSLTAGRAVPRDTDEGWPAQPQDACTTAPKPETHAPPAAPLAPATEAWPTGREEWRAMTRNVVSFCFFKILAAATRLVQDAPERRRYHTPKSITRELHCDYTSMGKFGNAPLDCHRNENGHKGMRARSWELLLIARSRRLSTSCVQNLPKDHSTRRLPGHRPVRFPGSRDIQDKAARASLSSLRARNAVSNNSSPSGPGIPNMPYLLRDCLYPISLDQRSARGGSPGQRS